MNGTAPLISWPGVRVPVYARVNGTQLRASYGLDLGVFLSF